ncbi:hypothetical protein J6590_021423 [Homalodisca vitripennis]|nr:hypothetical protein J6590_021423 [Homalodisca vitripennis]
MFLCETVQLGRLPAGTASCRQRTMVDTYDKSALKSCPPWVDKRINLFPFGSVLGSENTHIRLFTNRMNCD